MTDKHPQITHAEWLAKGEALFGKDYMKWKFKCPSCEYVASIQDYKDAGAPVGACGFSCLGRYKLGKQEAFSKELKKGTAPCNYTGGGLLNINPLPVLTEDGDVQYMFNFAE